MGDVIALYPERGVRRTRIVGLLVAPQGDKCAACGDGAAVVEVIDDYEWNLDVESRLCLSCLRGALNWRCDDARTLEAIRGSIEFSEPERVRAIKAASLLTLVPLVARPTASSASEDRARVELDGGIAVSVLDKLTRPIPEGQLGWRRLVGNVWWRLWDLA